VTFILPKSESNKKPIFARSGWEIPQETPPIIEPRLNIIRNNEIIKYHPYAIVRSNSNYPYNCVGMIFAARRAWIEIDHIYDIFKHDGYTRIDRSKIMEGDIVLYLRDGQPQHVGVIIFIDRALNNVKVLSKWGYQPEFVHLIDDVPNIFGVASGFFTERS
jgi:hypothetical protein